MGRIKINDLPRDQKVSKDEMKRVMGGVEPTTFPVIQGGAFPVFNAGKLSQGITGVNFKTANPIQYYPGSHWKR